jgi:hypothetical protein
MSLPRHTRNWLKAHLTATIFFNAAPPKKVVGTFLGGGVAKLGFGWLALIWGGVLPKGLLGLMSGPSLALL